MNTSKRIEARHFVWHSKCFLQVASLQRVRVFRSAAPFICRAGFDAIALAIDGEMLVSIARPSAFAGDLTVSAADRDSMVYTAETVVLCDRWRCGGARYEQ